MGFPLETQSAQVSGPAHGLPLETQSAQVSGPAHGLPFRNTVSTGFRPSTCAFL